MNKPITARPIPDAPRVSTSGRPASGQALADVAPRRKPTGPMIYRVEKGADVWPGRK
jgi:hypothetical protein